MNSNPLLHEPFSTTCTPIAPRAPVCFEGDYYPKQAGTTGFAAEILTCHNGHTDGHSFTAFTDSVPLTLERNEGRRSCRS